MVDSSGRIIILSALLLIVITIIAPLIREITETSFEETTSDIIFRYGTSGAKHQNELDTLKGIFTKDMVNKDPVTTKLELTQEEMDTTYLMMVKIDFFSYPKSFHPELEGNIVTMQTQFPVYYMEYHN